MNISWVVWEVLILAVVTYLAYSGVQRATRIGLVASSIEIVIFVVLAVALLLHPVSPVGIQPVLPSSAPAGWSGILGFGMVYGILNFVGFEAAAPLAEETRKATTQHPSFVLPIRAAAWFRLSSGLLRGRAGVGIGTFPGVRRVAVALHSACKPALGSGMDLHLPGHDEQLARLRFGKYKRFVASALLDGTSQSSAELLRPCAPHPANTLLRDTLSRRGHARTGDHCRPSLGHPARLCGAGRHPDHRGDDHLRLGNLALPVFYLKEHRSEFSVVRHALLPLAALPLLAYVVYRTVWPPPVYPFNVPAYVACAWIGSGRRSSSCTCR